jgi:hypothetical protein
MPRALEDLVDRCRSLPWPGAPPASVVVWPPPVPPPPELGDGGAPSRRAAARRLLADLLGALAARVGPALLQDLERAAHAWDQVDALALLDDELRAQADRAAQAWRAAGGPEATMAILTIDAALDLVRLLERRLATLVRLRARSAAPELVVGGRPFLDVAGALAEVARRWS